MTMVETRRPPSVVEAMAAKFGMAPDKFERTLRATVVPQGCGPEQFAAFLLVARDYNLNPITREIFAFPRPGGGIQPIVGVDGWMKLVNSHEQMDGLEFEDIVDSNGELVAIRCRIHRKDRKHPTEIIEYLSECKRATDTWKQWPARMLRHKAVIQAARYAFGFSGIMDTDEYDRWRESERGRVAPQTGLAPLKGQAAVEHFITHPVATGHDAPPVNTKSNRPTKTENTERFQAWHTTIDTTEPTPPTPEEWSDPETGEIQEQDDPESLTSAADAYEMGRKTREERGPLMIPKELYPHRALSEAWIAGWKSVDEEAE